MIIIIITVVKTIYTVRGRPEPEYQLPACRAFLVGIPSVRSGRRTLEVLVLDHETCTSHDFDKLYCACAVGVSKNFAILFPVAVREVRIKWSRTLCTTYLGIERVVVSGVILRVSAEPGLSRR